MSARLPHNPAVSSMAIVVLFSPRSVNSHAPPLLELPVAGLTLCAHKFWLCLSAGAKRRQVPAPQEFMVRSGNRRCYVVDRTRRPVLLTVCVLFRSPTSMDLARADSAPRWTGWARNTAPADTRCF
ncbi:Uncharacterised protein [Mycobacterium tuberculosis]|nr:Uncharacterised protein [Mycobacterium tuberculosis]